MRRFFINKKAITGNSVTISGEEAHHIRNVIRLKPGDRFIGLDGSGKAYTLSVKRLGGEIEAQIEKVSSKNLDMPKILLACALPKNSKIDYIIEKATELGVSDIIPMLTKRTIVKIDTKNSAAKQKRWEKICLSASKQCGRGAFPTIYETMNFKDAISLTERLGYNKRLLPCLCEGRRHIQQVIAGAKEIAVFIGPEGDFTGEEIEYAKSSGFELISLGELVLKVDTACIFTISAIQAFFVN